MVLGVCALTILFFPVYGDTAQTADGISQIDGVGGLQVLHGEDALFDSGLRLEQVAAVDAGKQTTFDGRRKPSACLFNKYVADGAFGHLTVLIEEEHIAISGLGCGFERFIVKMPVGGFVEEHAVV